MRHLDRENGNLIRLYFPGLPESKQPKMTMDFIEYIQQLLIERINARIDDLQLKFKARTYM